MENEVLSDNFSIEDSKDEILILSIDIGDGRRGQIKVNTKCNPDQLAIEFCSKHRLGAKAKILLTDEIEKHYAMALLRSRSSTKASATNISANSRSNSLAEEQTEPSPVKNFLVVSKRTPSSYLLSPSISLAKEQRIKLNQVKISHKKSFSNLVNPTNKSVRNLSPSVLKRVELAEKPTVNLPPKKESPEKTTSTLSKIHCNSIRKSPENLFRDKSALSSKRLGSPQKPTLGSGQITPYKLQTPTRSKSATRDQSDIIISKIKKKRYQDIFSMLLPDNKGLISELTINKASPSKIISIISPLIEEIKELDEKLSFNEFSDAMDQLMKVLNPTEKGIILNTAKPKPVVAEKRLSRPKTSQQSGKSILNLYERGLQQKKETWKRIMREQEEKAKLEMKECVFKPKISMSHRKTRSTVEHPNPYLSNFN